MEENLIFFVIPHPQTRDDISLNGISLDKRDELADALLNLFSKMKMDEPAALFSQGFAVAASLGIFENPERIEGR